MSTNQRILNREQYLGATIQTARKRVGLTQETMSRLTGLSYSTITKIERGAIAAPSIFTIYKIARAVDISLDDLMSRVTLDGDGQ